MSTVAWVDYDDSQKQRMNELIRMFKETDARDELGLGVIRDSLADLYFPGTMTLQTRVKYMLFIPWIFLDIENRKLESDRFDAMADTRERELSKILIKNSAENEWGIFGKMKEDVERLPSSIYWVGLREWGIRQFDGSLDDYYQSLGSYYVRINKLSIKDNRDDDIDTLDPFERNWHPGIPKKPDNFPDGAMFALTKDEAEYLIERITIKHAESVFAQMLENIGKIEEEDLWQSSKVKKLKKEQQGWVEHGRLFSKVMNGSALLYNYYIAALLKEDGFDKGKEWQKKYAEKIEEWVESILSEYKTITDWNINEFWGIVSIKSKGNYSRARDFVNSWIEIVKNKATLNDILKDEKTKVLIYARETYLKNRYSRLNNTDARKRWNGESGSGVKPFNYRWNVAKNYINELWDGVNSK
jgi:hypothetical protein